MVSRTLDQGGWGGRAPGGASVVPPPAAAPLPTVVLDGRGLGVGGIVGLAERTARPAVLDPGDLAYARESWETARRLAATGRVYGRSTGVGANRTQDVPADDGHGLRLLRSHAGAIGDPLPAREVRANQLLAGGAGLRPEVITALVEALESGAYPVVNEYGAVGTGDLAALSEPDFTRLRPFLGDHAPASSGMMILEYAAGAALGELRAASQPASLGHAVLSRGVEEQAGFASLAARQALRAGVAYRRVPACELVAAVWALRMRSLEPEPGVPAARAFAVAAGALDARMADRPLTADVAVAETLLDGPAAL
ncbi:aromatic amino acid lyase [Streptomyces rimosus]|uniref:aromatic amino acid lyase n=1 Tax=Streptomyces rimosus TaxID=1927 RepID=UPI0007C52241|nr:aromatic amino acid lyase [Streptomyces rimosus]